MDAVRSGSNSNKGNGGKSEKTERLEKPLISSTATKMMTPSSSPPPPPREGFVGVHIGAGQHSEARTAAYLAICAAACQRAVRALLDGGSALDAATEATIVLEDAGDTNAGYGSNLVGVSKYKPIFCLFSVICVFKYCDLTFNS